MSEPRDTFHVIHVDDDQHTRELTATYLERTNERLTVHTATDASAGWELLDDVPVDCIVSDYEMPGQDGITFLRAVREKHPDLPFILFTGKGSETVASDAISAGVTDYLQKGSGTDQYTVLANRLTNAIESYRSQAALVERNSELRKYKRMINSMQEAAWIYDHEGRFKIVNKSLASWYDTTQDSLEGRRGNLIPHIRDGAGETDPFQEILHGDRERFQDRVEMDFPGHGHATVEYRLSPLSTDDDANCVVGVARDVTEPQYREERLRRYKTIFETIDDSAFVVDEGWRVTHANPTSMDNVDVTGEEVLGESIVPLVEEFTTADDDVQQFTNALEAAFAGPETETPDRIDLTLSVGGERQVFEHQFSPIVEDGAVSAVAITSRDVTKQKDRERRLQAQNERLDQFASVVSHDLRNPLHIAASNLELANEEHHSEYVSDALDAIERSQTLVDDLLTLAREGDEGNAVESIELSDIARRCWDTVETHEATLTVEAELSVRADPNRLRQFFENLCRNAVKHGGSAVSVTVGELPNGFYVEDDGDGIPADEHEQIFDAGYSTHSSGTGFGLRIVQNVADAHGWEVTVTESQAGGARFEVSGVEPLVRN